MMLQEGPVNLNGAIAPEIFVISVLLLHSKIKILQEKFCVECINYKILESW